MDELFGMLIGGIFLFSLIAWVVTMSASGVGKVGKVCKGAEKWANKQ
jgi:hypothetical protein